MIKYIPACLLALVLVAPVMAADERAPATQPDRDAIQKQLAEKLSGATLDGWYTIDGQEEHPKRDKYTLGKVFHVEGDVWHIDARIQFGGKDVTVPLQLPIRWAGDDTPVICVTGFKVPLLGTYTARVVFTGDRYAGTWSGATHGGSLWGRIQRPTTQPQSAPAPDAK